MRKSKCGCNPPLYLDSNQGARDYQEDYFGVSSQGGKTLMAVTDGMGGHSSGDLASRWVVEELIGAFEKDQAIDGFVSSGIKQALGRMNDSKKDMGCTLVLGLLEKEGDKFKFSFTWIGDSRIYLLGSSEKPTDNAKVIDQRNGRTLWLLSDDDSFVWGFFLNNELTIDQLTQHPNKNQLEFSIHPRQEHVDEILCKRIRTCNVQENDRILFCTDGIWESYLMQSEIMNHMGDSHPKKAIHDHLKKALRAERFNDNGTYILADVGEKILNQNCLPGKMKRKFPGSLFFAILALILFAVIFFLLTGKFKTRTERQPVPPRSSQFQAENSGKKQNQVLKKGESRKAYFVIQVASFPNFDEAKYYSEKFRQLGYPVEISSPDPLDANPSYHVYVGHFNTLSAADEKRKELEKTENTELTVRTRY
jgi:serine/threonine protein phosphatase PrpC